MALDRSNCPSGENLAPGALAWATALLVVASAGCGPTAPGSLEGFGSLGEEESEGPSGDGDGDGDPAGDGDGPDEQSCIDANFGSEAAVVFEGNLGPELANDHDLTCGESPGPDYSFTWTAPSSGGVRAEIYAEFASHLSILRGGCEGPSEGCGGFEGSNFVDFDALEGQTYTVVLDSDFAASNPFVFGMYFFDEPAESCPDGELPSQTQVTVSGSTSGGANSFSSSCGGEDAPERSYIFVPPQSGLYVIDMLGSSFDTMLHVFDGVCGGVPLECNDDYYELISRVDVFLEAGEIYTIVADGFGPESGNFQLNVALDGQPAGLCEGIETLPSQAPVGSSWPEDFSEQDLFGECSPLLSERRHRWTAPADGSYRAGLDAGDAVHSLGVVEGCESEAHLCGAAGGNATALVEFEALAGQELVFVSEWEPGAGQDCELLIEPVVVPIQGCGESLGSDLPVSVAGTSEGSGNMHNGSCSVNGAPEVEYHWTPDHSGSYQFSLEGSNFDTILYVRRGGCDGEELACNDDTFVDEEWVFWSRVTLDLFEDETVSIFVDGYSGPGQYELRIDELE